MSGIANEVIAKRQNRRLNNFLVSLAKKLKGVSEKINRDFISKEEFQDLTEDIFSKAAETKQKEKFEALKAIFLIQFFRTNQIIMRLPRWLYLLSVGSLDILF